MAVTHLNKESFQEMISDGISMVDFWATWCIPCQALMPVMDDLESTLNGSAKIGKVNVNEEPEIVKEFCVKSIPTVIFFKDGKEVDRLVGGFAKSKYLEHLQAIQ